MDLLKKLQVKDPDQFFVVNCPENLQETLFAENLTQQIDFNTYQRGAVLMFVRNSSELNERITGFAQDKDSDNHWIAFPKRTSGIPTDLGRDHGWDQLAKEEWIPVRQISLNDKWSALRFRPKANVKEIKRGTDYPGIDSKKKTVTIPAALEERLISEGVKDVFEALSFTKRKEAVISVLDAKKPETLERRIIKILGSLD